MEQIRMARYTKTGIVPTRKHPDDAGLDLFADEDCLICGHEMAVIGTGIAVDIPAGYVGLVLNKSRNNFLLGGGVVDAGYQGEIRVKVINVRNESLEIVQGQAIAQLLILPIETPAVAVVSIDKLFSAISARGESGGIHKPV